jgi:hypothetical protein
MRKLADEVWAEHEPDDSGLCPRCKVVDCRPRRNAAKARETYKAGPNVPVFEPETDRPASEAVDEP